MTRRNNFDIIQKSSRKSTVELGGSTLRAVE